MGNAPQTSHSLHVHYFACLGLQELGWWTYNAYKNTQMKQPYKNIKERYMGSTK